MSKLFKIFLSLFLVIFIFNKKIVSYYYIKKFSSWVERPVEISHINFEYSGLVEIEDIRILNSNESYFNYIFQAEKISFNFDVKSLISELIIINNIDITNPQFFLDFSSSEIIISSAFLSAFVTKLFGPFKETCNFSSSPKSLISIFEAFSDALIIKFKLGEIEFMLYLF